MIGMYQISTPEQWTGTPFAAGLEVDWVKGQGDAEPTEKVVEAAPILKYMVGWRISHVIAFCSKRGWVLDGPVKVPIRKKQK